MEVGNTWKQAELIHCPYDNTLSQFTEKVHNIAFKYDEDINRQRSLRPSSVTVYTAEILMHVFEEQIEVRECLLSFGAESVVFQIAIQKLKDQDI